MGSRYRNRNARDMLRAGCRARLARCSKKAQIQSPERRCLGNAGRNLNQQVKCPNHHTHCEPTEGGCQRPLVLHLRATSHAPTRLTWKANTRTGANAKSARNGTRITRRNALIGAKMDAPSSRIAGSSTRTTPAKSAARCLERTIRNLWRTKQVHPWTQKR
jgi:hypothetical protein